MLTFNRPAYYAKQKRLKVAVFGGHALAEDGKAGPPFGGDQSNVILLNSRHDGFIVVGAFAVLLAVAGSSAFWPAIYFWLVPVSLRLPNSLHFGAGARLLFALAGLTLLVTARIRAERWGYASPQTVQPKIAAALRSLGVVSDASALFAAIFLGAALLSVIGPPSPPAIAAAFLLFALNSTIRPVQQGFSSSAKSEGFVGLRRKPDDESALKRMVADPRPPILYLRSFEAEVEKVLVRDRIFGRFTNVRGNYLFGRRPRPGELRRLLKRAMRYAFARIAYGTQRTAHDEQFLFAEFFADYGPYIALARPGENFTNMDIGSVKLTVSDHEWREKIVTLLEDCSAVLVDLSDTASLAWEIGEVVRRVRPRKVLLMAPRDIEAYRNFYQVNRNLFPKGIPFDRPDSRLIMFADDWSPRVLDNPTLALEDALEPFCRANHWIG